MHANESNNTAPRATSVTDPRILGVIPSPDPITGGIEVDLRVISELRRRGWPVSVEYLEPKSGVAPRYRLWNQILLNLRLLLKFRHATEPCILFEDQAMSGGVLVFNLYMSKRKRAKVVLLAHHVGWSLWRFRVRRWTKRVVESFVARRADLILAPSESTRRDLVHLGVEPDRIVVISEAARLATGDGAQHAPLGARGSTCRILAVGTVEPRKNTDLLI